MVSCATGNARKSGRPSVGVLGGEQHSVSLIGGPDFDCVSAGGRKCTPIFFSGL